MVEIDRLPVLPNQGASFQSHSLQELSAFEMAFRPTATCLLFSWIFIGLGLLALPSFGFAFIATGELGALFAAPIGLLFAAIGFWFYKQNSAPRSFRLDRSVVYVPRREFALRPEMECIAFADIEALQIVEKRVRGNKQSYNSYELNVVTKSGERHNVVDHGAGQALLAEAQKIASRIGCRVVVDADLTLAM